MEIHIRKNGQSTGPYSLEQIQEALARNEITLSDKAWHVGLSVWKPLNVILNPPERGKLATKIEVTPSTSPQMVAGEWEALCPQCVKVIGTPSTLFCPNCHGLLQLEGGFTTRLKCVRCSEAVTDVRCGTCKSLANGEYIRRTALGVRTFNTATDEASVAVCPACDSTYSNKIRDTGCATVLWFLISLPFLLIPYFIYALMARYRLPNTKCLGCGHVWNARANRGQRAKSKLPGGVRLALCIAIAGTLALVSLAKGELDLGGAAAVTAGTAATLYVVLVVLGW